jgi:hypothetical protein
MKNVNKAQKRGSCSPFFSLNIELNGKKNQTIRIPAYNIPLTNDSFIQKTPAIPMLLQNFLKLPMNRGLFTENDML